MDGLLGFNSKPLFKMFSECAGIARDFAKVVDQVRFLARTLWKFEGRSEKFEIYSRFLLQMVVRIAISSFASPVSGWRRAAGKTSAAVSNRNQ